MIKKEKPTFKKYNRSNLFSSSKYSFYEYYNINFNSLSLTSKYEVLTSFYDRLNKFYILKPQKESAKEKKTTVHDNVSGIYMYLETYFDQYMALSDSKKRKLGNKYDSVNLFLETYNYDDWFKNEKSANTTRKSDKESVDLSDMPPPGSDE